MNYPWESNIRKVDPYTPGEQPTDPSIIKLNTNENPYGPSDDIKKAMGELSTDLFKKYPDAKAEDLVNTLADYHKVGRDQVFVGVGSDDVLGMCFMTFFNSEKPVLFPDITYSFYPVWAELLKISYKTLALNESFEIDIDDFIQENGGVVIPNPNAPTSILLDKDKIVYLLENNKSSVVIIDEAYIDFAKDGSSVIDLVDRFDNLVVVRTFSKSRSLAGLRVGYAVANPVLIKFLNDVKYSYNSYTMNYPSIKLGSAVIADEEYFRATIKKIINTRQWFTEELRGMGFVLPDSSTNFVFAEHTTVPAKEIFEEAKKNKIYFRYFNLPRIDNRLRITIGTEEEMKKVVDFLKKFLG